jgi:hypothetical protein
MAGSPLLKGLGPGLGSKRGTSGKVQARFGLPSTEIVLEKYVCALQRNQEPEHRGKLYVFPNYVAFACDLPGDSCSMLLKLSEVSRVKKAKTLFVLPNAIEVHMTGGKTHHFTSFLSRNEAYNQIYDLSLIAKGIEAAKAETSQSDEAALCSSKPCGSNTLDCGVGKSRSFLLFLWSGIRYPTLGP